MGSTLREERLAKKRPNLPAALGKKKAQKARRNDRLVITGRPLLR